MQKRIQAKRRANPHSQDQRLKLVRWKGPTWMFSQYDPNQFTISHFAHALLPANIVACAGT